MTSCRYGGFNEAAGIPRGKLGTGTICRLAMDLLQ